MKFIFMMKRALLLSILLFVGCQKKPSQNALAKIREFSVQIFLSPYEGYDAQKVSVEVYEALEKFGVVKEQQSSDRPVLLLSLSGSKEKRLGSLQVIAKARVEKNGVVVPSKIWERELMEGEVEAPELDKGEVRFVKKELSHNVIEGLIAEFAKSYEEANGEMPVYCLDKKSSFQ